MDHINNPQRGRHRAVTPLQSRIMKLRQSRAAFIAMLLMAFAAISVGVWWAYNDLQDAPNPGISITNPTETVTTPTPTTPTCPSGQVWSQHASKCYVPKTQSGHEIDAIPTTTPATSATPSNMNGS